MKTSGIPQMFHSAHNTTIQGGIFAAVGGDMTIHNTHRADRPGLRLLLANITQGAFHDAAERGDPPKCRPHTREAILAEIMEWIKDPEERRRFVIWLYGPAGSGKTAICQSIAEICEREGLLAASFFFGRLAAGRDSTSFIIATLAYQLSRSIPEIEDPLITAIEKDPTIFSRTLATQMRILIVEPLMLIHSTNHPRLVVIDGVDECGPNDMAHKELLNVLGNASLGPSSLSIPFSLSLLRESGTHPAT
ncbi:hypothetical protein BDN70DRAFT_868592 [Pholiota conissans]|uniref:Nephrocystin 3-like N-terminal domain-containing protein n=1 Tax=Pholiota conissans TaxID=109636 RepID=A0A9P5YNK0_9AGAR|nr:hypothetical protein BDN70DRAFT_868592 [Pholiota conissans]